MNRTHIGLIVGLGLLAVTATTVVAQHGHGWIPPARQASVNPARPVTSIPQALSGAASSGLYCPDMADHAVGVHELGWLPTGVSITVIVSRSSASTELDPVAALVVVSMGSTAGNTIKPTTYYDNDSGGEKDAKLDIVTTQEGTYMLLVGDNSGSAGGCYRYQVSVR